MLLSLLRDLRSYYHGSRGRDQAEFYDLESRLPYYDRAGEILGRTKDGVILEFLLPPERPGDPVLELGCGVGTLARTLAGRGESVVGLDISPRKIEKARRREAEDGARPGRIEYVAGDLREIGSGGAVDDALRRARESLAAGGGGGDGAPEAAAGSDGRRPLRFRRIVAADVLEHVPLEPAGTVRRVRGLLEPGGQLVASIPSRLCLRDPGHLWRIGPQEWESIFREAGLATARRRMSRVGWSRLITPLPLALVLDLRP